MIKFCAKGAYKSDNKFAESAKQMHFSGKNLLNILFKKRLLQGSHINQVYHSIFWDA